MPASSATGSVSAGSTSQPPSGVTTTAAISIDAARPSMPLTALVARHAVGEHDVEGEEHGVRERERHAQRLAGEAHVGEQVHARHGERERAEVARGARAERRERDHREELDRRDRAERQPVDGQVEAAVHERQHGAPGRAAAAARRRRAARARARAAARRRRRAPRRRSAARPRRARPRGRTAAPRTPARGSGTRR